MRGGVAGYTRGSRSRFTARCAAWFECRHGCPRPVYRALLCTVCSTQAQYMVQRTVQRTVQHTLQNTVHNAVKHAGADGSVRILARMLCGVIEAPSAQRHTSIAQYSADTGQHIVQHSTEQCGTHRRAQCISCNSAYSTGSVETSARMLRGAMEVWSA